MRGAVALSTSAKSQAIKEPYCDRYILTVFRLCHPPSGAEQGFLFKSLARPVTLAIVPSHHRHSYRHSYHRSSTVARVPGNVSTISSQRTTHRANNSTTTSSWLIHGTLMEFRCLWHQRANAAPQLLQTSCSVFMAASGTDRSLYSQRECQFVDVSIR